MRRIEVNPEILSGKPVIKGTRITVYVILNLLSEGYSINEIIEFYPDLTREDILECIKYTSKVIERQKIYEIT
ncbi:MAG TPA: DUF433 domain-containing protein [Caldisericia bacterium]|nr:DUF433 domain-containing protein [Caldisericia bacterium]HQN49118.1 DUF433 domain-containing protein [Caldisericia bacterium]